MYSYEERKKAVELYIKFDKSACSVVRELGYPTGVLCSATPHKPAAYFQYDLSRSSDVLKGMVGEYNGYLQADADAGYQTSKQDYRFTLCLCAAHLRRKFVDAQKAGAYKQGSPGYITLERKIPPVKPSSQALFYQKYQTDYMFFTLLICLVSVLKSIQQKTRIGFCC